MGEKFSQILFILRPFEDTLQFDDLISIDQFLRLVEGHPWRENESLYICNVTQGSLKVF